MDNASNSDNASSAGDDGEQMDLLYLLLPIVGAFFMLFAVCCCGRRVKEILHLPKEFAIGRPSRQMELMERRATAQQQQQQQQHQQQQQQQQQQPSTSTTSDTRQGCASGESHSHIECVASSDDAFAVQMDATALQALHPLQAPCCNKRYIGDVTEQELEALLLSDTSQSPARLRHDSGIANCSCHRSLMSVEVTSDAIVIEEEREDGSGEEMRSAQCQQPTEDADAITVIEHVAENSERSCSRAQPEVPPLGPWSHLRDPRTRRKSGNSAAGTATAAAVKARLHRSLCEGLHTSTADAASAAASSFSSPCHCNISNSSATQHPAFRYTVSFDCTAEDVHHHPQHHTSGGRDATSEDSRRRHLSVGSCDTTESDIIIHVVNDDNQDNVFS